MQMISENPDERPSAEQCLAHPWFMTPSRNVIKESLTKLTPNKINQKIIQYEQDVQAENISKIKCEEDLEVKSSSKGMSTIKVCLDRLPKRLLNDINFTRHNPDDPNSYSSLKQKSIKHDKISDLKINENKVLLNKLGCRPNKQDQSFHRKNCYVFDLLKQASFVQAPTDLKLK